MHGSSDNHFACNFVLYLVCYCNFTAITIANYVRYEITFIVLPLRPMKFSGHSNYISHNVTGKMVYLV